MAEIAEVRVGGEQGDRAQAREANPNHRGNLRWYALVVLIAIAAIVATAAFTLSRSGESAHAVSHVGDYSQMMHMGHLLLTEWDVTALNASLNDELKHGESVLEIHNDGQTVHRLAIWRGGVVEGDQVVGGTLIAETEYIQPGKMTNIDVDLESGAYVLVCSVRGHLARGMYATVNSQ